MDVSNDQLLRGTMRGDGRALRELLRRLRPHTQATLWDRFGNLGGAQAEILDDAESLLFEWSIDPRASELLRARESLGALAFRLVLEVVRRKARAQRRQDRIAAELSQSLDTPSVEPPQPTFGTGAIEETLMALPAVHREVLIAETNFQCGEGPPPAQVLHTSDGAARVRLCRARTVFYRALVDKGLIDPQEKVHG
jgi:DNA-directed RNA polymerase specialized sigma24 family protein